jgi:Fe-S cluster assembly scaffold protein SufB
MQPIVILLKCDVKGLLEVHQINTKIIIKQGHNKFTALLNLVTTSHMSHIYIKKKKKKKSICLQTHPFSYPNSQHAKVTDLECG